MDSFKRRLTFAEQVHKDLLKCTQQLEALNRQSMREGGAGIVPAPVPARGTQKNSGKGPRCIRNNVHLLQQPLRKSRCLKNNNATRARQNQGKKVRFADLLDDAVQRSRTRRGGIDAEAAMREDGKVAKSGDTCTAFKSRYQPDEMRCVALFAHGRMQSTMKEFVQLHKQVLKKFRLTGSDAMIDMLEKIFRGDPDVVYGPRFSSGSNPRGHGGPLSIEDLGGVIFFADPLAAPCHEANIDSLARLANVHGIVFCTNPVEAGHMMIELKSALEKGRKDQMASFFYNP